MFAKEGKRNESAALIGDSLVSLSLARSFPANVQSKTQGHMPALVGERGGNQIERKTSSVVCHKMSCVFILQIIAQLLNGNLFKVGRTISCNIGDAICNCWQKSKVSGARHHFALPFCITLHINMYILGFSQLCRNNQLE